MKRLTVFIGRCSVTFGRNKAAAAQHFPSWAKEKFTAIIDLMKDYLKTAFSVIYFTDND
jgi:hypothetical protein